MSSCFAFLAPTKLLFGAGSLSRLGSEALPGTRALIVTTGGKSVKENGSLARVEAELDRAGASHVLFDRIEPNPLRETVNEGGWMARTEGCDFVVALGGGSVMDGCKAICTMAANPARAADGSEAPGDIWDYMNGGTAKGLAIPNDPLPLVCIPTTAGTGSEVDAGGIVSCVETDEKLRLGDPRLFSRLSVVDPQIQLTVPQKLTAYQGFDAMFHNIECFISKSSTPMGDMVCREGVRVAASALPAAVADGFDLDARTKMAWASTMGGYAMCASGTTGSHAIEHAMSAHHHSLPHGAGLIMISRAYHGHMIESHMCDDRYIQLARLMGHDGATHPDDFLDELARLQEECGVAGLKMSDWGFDPVEFGAIADNAMTTTKVLLDHDPVELTRDDIIDILEKSYR